MLEVHDWEYGEGAVLVCLDETSKQRTRETRTSLPVRPDRPAGCDFEYGRNGTADLFMLHALLDGWCHVEVTDRRTRKDFAGVLKDLADVRFPGKGTVLVMDNLTRTGSRHCTGRSNPPKHGIWLNMAEIEIGVLS